MGARFVAPIAHSGKSTTETRKSEAGKGSRAGKSSGGWGDWGSRSGTVKEPRAGDDKPASRGARTRDAIRSDTGGSGGRSAGTGSRATNQDRGKAKDAGIRTQDHGRAGKIDHDRSKAADRRKSDAVLRSKADRASDRNAEHRERAARLDRQERLERLERLDRQARLERQQRLDRLERLDRIDRPGRGGKKRHQR